MPKPDYGLDAPKLVRRFAVRGALFIAFGGLLYYSNRNTSPGAALAIASISLAVGITFAAIAIIMVWSSRVAKPKVVHRILDTIPWRGDENVLDVGCGRGLFLIAAAQTAEERQGYRRGRLAGGRSLGKHRRGGHEQRQSGGRG